MSSRIPVTLVTGATGAGKTTFVSRLVADRPAAERWAVLVNDFGAAKLATVDGEVVVREVVGCICCTGQVSLRTALVALLREARPQRLIVEASAAAHPAAIVKVLNEPGLAAAVALERTLCVVDPKQAADARYAGSEVYREQLRNADAVVMREGADAEARAVLESLGAAPLADERQNGFSPARE